jgi:hypothetical protein
MYARQHNSIARCRLLEYLSAMGQPGYNCIANKWRCTCMRVIAGEEATSCDVGGRGAVAAWSVVRLREKMVVLNKIRSRKDGRWKIVFSVGQLQWHVGDETSGGRSSGRGERQAPLGERRASMRRENTLDLKADTEKQNHVQRLPNMYTKVNLTPKAPHDPPISQTTAHQ